MVSVVTNGRKRKMHVFTIYTVNYVELKYNFQLVFNPSVRFPSTHTQTPPLISGGGTCLSLLQAGLCFR